MIEPTDRSIPPVRMTAVMPMAMMPTKAKLRVMLKKLSVLANACGWSQDITTQISSNAISTQKGWLPSRRCRAVFSLRPVTSSISTLVCSGRVLCMIV